MDHEQALPPRLHPDDLVEIAKIAASLRDGHGRSGVPYIADGRDAVMFREVAKTLFEEQVRHRRFLTETEARAIAKEVATAVCSELGRALEKRIDTFLIKAQIEDMIVEKFEDLGLRADKEHIFETRKTVEGLVESHANRSAMKRSFSQEFVKALAAWALAGLLAMAGFLGIKSGGGH